MSLIATEAVATGKHVAIFFRCVTPHSLNVSWFLQLK